MELEMQRIKRGRQFIKDFKSSNISDQHYAKLIIYLANLLKGEPLPPEAKDHALKGEWTGFRELHVSGDLLLIYKLSEENLYLIRIGSHAQLFR